MWLLLAKLCKHSFLFSTACGSHIWHMPHVCCCRLNKHRMFTGSVHQVYIVLITLKWLFFLFPLDCIQWIIFFFKVRSFIIFQHLIFWTNFLLSLSQKLDENWKLSKLIMDIADILFIQYFFFLFWKSMSFQGMGDHGSPQITFFQICEFLVWDVLVSCFSTILHSV